MVRWLEANGYNVSYSTGVDTDRRGAEHPASTRCSCRSATTSTGRARSAPTSKRRAPPACTWRSSAATRCSGRRAGRTASRRRRPPYRTLVTYKETHANAKIDPHANVWTGTWRDPALQPAGRRRPARERADRHDLPRQLRHRRRSRCRRPTARCASGATPRSPTWRRARSPRCRTARSATSGTRIVDNGFRPAGLIRLSDTTVSGVDYLQDYGSTYAPGTANHALTLYRHASGALVFGAGTVQWSWGLDSNHDRGVGGAEPGDAAGDGQPVRRHGRAAADDAGRAGRRRRASTDTAAPTSTITSPAAGSAVPRQCHRHDHRHGRRRRRRPGRRRRGLGRRRRDLAPRHRPRQLDLLLADRRAADGHAPQPRRRRQRQHRDCRRTGITVTVGTGTVDLPLLDLDAAPRRPTAGRRSATRSAVELGTRFRSDVDGYITGDPLLQEPPEHRPAHRQPVDRRPARVLATVTFTGETASGWQEATLPDARWRSPPTRPTSSRTTPTRATTPARTATSPPAASTTVRCTRCRTASTAPTASTATARARFPTETYDSENYWVDVVFVTSVGARHDAADRSASSTPANGAIGVAAEHRGDGHVQRAMNAADDHAARRSSCATPSNVLVAGDASPTRRRPARPRSQPNAALAYSHDLHGDA